MSRIFAAYSVGGLIGPALGVFGGIHGPFIAYLGPHPAGRGAPGLAARRPKRQPDRSSSADRTALRTRGFWLASAAILFAVLALGVLEGVLPLHLAERVTQAEIAALYVGASIVVAVSPRAAAGGVRPRPLVIGGIFLRGRRHLARGRGRRVSLWLLALLLAGLGIGIGNTGSIGMLVEAVPVERIVAAMVVWSQIGIAGYLIGPLLGGAVADGLGFAYLGLVPAVAGILVLALLLQGPQADRPLSHRAQTGV